MHLPLLIVFTKPSWSWPGEKITITISEFFHLLKQRDEPGGNHGERSRRGRHNRATGGVLVLLGLGRVLGGFAG